MGTCKVPHVVSHVIFYMRSTQIRHRLDIDSTSYHCYVYIVAKLVERVIADQLRIARRVEHGASEPEDRSHVQRSDGDGESEPDTTNFTAAQRADGDIVCTLTQFRASY